MDRQFKAKAGVPWKLYFLLLTLAAAGALGLLPSIPVVFAGVLQSTGMPLPLFMVATFLQTFLLTAVLGFLGLLLRRKTGLGAPVLESCVYRNADSPSSAVTAPFALGKSGAAVSSLAGAAAISAVVGLAAGAAACGLRPIVEIMFMDFMTVCMDGIVNQIAKMRYMFGSQYIVPIVIRTPAGAGLHAGSDLLAGAARE